MKNSQIIIIAALAIPIIGLVALSHSGPKNPGYLKHTASPKNAPSPRPKAQALVDIKKRLDAANAMTEEEFKKLRLNNHMLPAEVTSVEQYRARTKARLAEVEAMTDEQWRQDEEERMHPERKKAAEAKKADNSLETKSSDTKTPEATSDKKAENKPDVKTETKTEEKTEIKSEAKAETKPVAKSAVKSEEKTVAKKPVKKVDKDAEDD